MDVGTIVARSMRRYRDRIALVGPDGTKTYGEVGARIFQLARALRALGLKSEDRVLDLQSNQIIARAVEHITATYQLLCTTRIKNGA